MEIIEIRLDWISKNIIVSHLVNGISHQVGFSKDNPEDVQKLEDDRDLKPIKDFYWNQA